jgi:hypothetical protein
MPPRGRKVRWYRPGWYYIGRWAGVLKGRGFLRPGPVHFLGPLNIAASALTPGGQAREGGTIRTIAPHQEKFWKKLEGYPLMFLSKTTGRCRFWSKFWRSLKKTTGGFWTLGHCPHPVRKSWLRACWWWVDGTTFSPLMSPKVFFLIWNSFSEYPKRVWHMWMDFDDSFLHSHYRYTAYFRVYVH